MKKVYLMLISIFIVSTVLAIEVTQNVSVNVVESTEISNKSITAPACILETDNVTLNAQVTGYCVEEIIFSALLGGEWKNFTEVNVVGANYSAKINSSFFAGHEWIEWTVFAKDCFNITTQDGTESFYVHSITHLTTNPATPDGQNNWFITEPEFILNNSDANQISYRWDGTGEIIYASPFKLENTPNNASIIGGIVELNFWSDVCSEPVQTRIFKVDMQSPVITRLVPEANSLVNNQKPLIQALLDEVYGSNSGINKESVVMFLDGDVVPATVFDADSIDAIVRYTPTSNLAEGEHEVMINAMDNAGRTSQLSWTFEVRLMDLFNLTVYSPEETFYGDGKIPLNITTLLEVSKIEYIDNTDRNPRWRSLCRNCNEYGFGRRKTKTFKEGWHDVTIKATGKYGSVKEENRTFFVDNKAPKIYDFTPEDEEIISGTRFEVEYSEDFLEKVELYWRVVNESDWNIVELQNCESGRKESCAVEVDELTEYNDEWIEFFFNVSDKVYSTTSEVAKVLVDTDEPIIFLNSPLENVSLSEKKVLLDVWVDEEVAEIEYKDLKDNNPKFRKLCKKCSEYNRTKTFRDGAHEVIVRATDYVGHVSEEVVEFFVDSDEPRIKRIFPRDKSLVAGTLFSVNYREENLKDVKLVILNSTETEVIYLDGCLSGKREVCEIEKDLSEYDGKHISFYFNVSDSVSETMSKIHTIYVDASEPEVFVNFPEEGGIFEERRVRLDIRVSEKVKLEYIDFLENNARFRTLCRSCQDYNKTKTFDAGPHSLLIRATDLAGNVGEAGVGFDVVLG